MTLEDAINVCKDALEKRIPKTPRLEHKNYYCPSCGEWIMWDDAIPNEYDNFCGKCGQAIDFGQDPFCPPSLTTNPFINTKINE